MKNLTIKSEFTDNLPADKILENTRRQVENAAYSYVNPKQTSNPKVVHTSKEMASELGI